MLGEFLSQRYSFDSFVCFCFYGSFALVGLVADFHSDNEFAKHLTSLNIGPLHLICIASITQGVPV